MNRQNYGHLFRLGCMTITLGALCSVSSVFAEEANDAETRAQLSTSILQNVAVGGTLIVDGVTTLNSVGNAIKGLNVNDITPLTKVVTPNTKTPSEPIITYVADECATTRLRGNAAINPHNTLYVNEINPLRVKNPNFQGTKIWVEDDSAATCFSGNLAVMPCTNVNVGNGGLFVNDIHPVRTVPLKEAGQVVLDCAGNQLMTCVADNKGAINFNGNLGIHPNNELWVNNINAVTTITDEATGCTLCVPDDSCEAMTSFASNIRVRDSHIFGQIDEVSLLVTPTSILKLSFDVPILSPNLHRAEGGEPGAYVKLYFMGTDEFGFYDVMYTQEFYVNPAGSTELGGSTQSIINGDLDSVESLVFENFGDVYIMLGIDSTVTTTYNGTIHYEIVAAHNLNGIECKPIVPLG